MSLATDLIRRRAALTPLADEIAGIAVELRERGFVTAFAGDDWFAEHCSADELMLHAQVTRDLFVEALHAPSIATLTYDNSYRFLSPLLREIAPLRSGSGHFSPCERELVAARASGSGPTSVDFEARRHTEYVVFREEIARWERQLVGCASEAEMQQCIASHIGRCFPYDASLFTSTENGDRCVAVNLSPSIRDSSLLLVPIVSCNKVGQRMPVTGAMRVGFRLLDQGSLEQVLLHLDLGLPGRWSSYNVFESTQELCLLCWAWELAAQVMYRRILTLNYSR